MNNIFNIFGALLHPWFIYLISLIIIFIYSLSSSKNFHIYNPEGNNFNTKLDVFNQKKNSPKTNYKKNELASRWSQILFHLWNRIQPSQTLDNFVNSQVGNGNYKLTTLGLLLLLIYISNILNYYNLYNNVEIIFNNFIITPPLIIMFCFILIAIFFIGIIII